MASILPEVVVEQVRTTFILCIKQGSAIPSSFALPKVEINLDITHFAIAVELVLFICHALGHTPPEMILKKGDERKC